MKIKNVVYKVLYLHTLNICAQSTHQVHKHQYSITYPLQY